MKKEELEIFLEKRRKKAEEDLTKAKIYTSCLISELEKLGKKITVEYNDTIYGPSAELIVGEKVTVWVYPLIKEKDKFIVSSEIGVFRTDKTKKLYDMLTVLL